MAIVGGGAAGALLAIALGGSGLRVVVIEPGEEPGRGVAYSTRDARHRLNVPGRGMSAVAGDPSHFVAWSGAAPDAFVSRGVYGDYLEAMLRQACADGTRVLRDTVAAIEERAGGVELRLGSGARRSWLRGRCWRSDPGRRPIRSRSGTSCATPGATCRTLGRVARSTGGGDAAGRHRPDDGRHRAGPRPGGTWWLRARRLALGVAAARPPARAAVPRGAVHAARRADRSARRGCAGAGADFGRRGRSRRRRLAPARHPTPLAGSR